MINKKLSGVLILCIFFLLSAHGTPEETESTQEEIEDKEDIDEDPIVEDLSKVDFSTLEIISKEMVPNLSEGVECEHIQDEITTYRYHALTASGDRVEIHLGQGVIVIPAKHVTTTQVQHVPLGKGATDEEVHKFTVEFWSWPYLDCFQMDHPTLVKEVKEMIHSPSGEEYNFYDLESNIHGETGHPDDVDRIVFGGQLKNGFFMESGSVDAETFSDTLYFELNHNWTGLLVEAVPGAFAAGLMKNRKTHSIQTCLSTETKPKLVDFAQTHAWMEDGHGQGMGGIVNETTTDTIKIQCIPFYSILLALGNPTVHWISLDIEGAEFVVLKTVPWDKVDIQALTVETHMLGKLFPGDREEFIKYMDGVGYRHIKDAHMGTNQLRQQLGTIDDLFVRKDVPLAEERLNAGKNDEPIAEGKLNAEKDEL